MKKRLTIVGLACAAALSAAADSLPLATRNYVDRKVSATVSETNAVFSAAVLAVATNISTNDVAEINALIDDAQKLPVGGTAGVGALLVALAAAVSKLKKKHEALEGKVDTANAALEEVA